jgi:hypothetical protein
VSGSQVVRQINGAYQGLIPKGPRKRVIEEHESKETAGWEGQFRPCTAGQFL